MELKLFYFTIFMLSKLLLILILCKLIIQILTTHTFLLSSFFFISAFRKKPCHHQKFADIVFEMLLLNHQKLDPEVILAIVDKTLLVILLNIDVTPLINFFSSKIKVLLEKIKENIPLVSTAIE